MSSEAKRIDAATVIAERVIAYLHTLDGLNPCLRRAPEDQLRDLQRDVSAIVGDALSAVEQACAVPAPFATPSKSEGEWVAPGEPRRHECADPNCGLSTDTAEAFRVIRDCEQYDYCHVECAMSHERDLGRQDGIAESEGEWVSVDERLPPTGCSVLVDGGCAYFDGQVWRTLMGASHRVIEWPVTHWMWMRLPSPPKAPDAT